MTDAREKVRMVRAQIGWAYDDMNWLSEAQARVENRKRIEIINELSHRLNSSFSGHKIHSGELSPGCSCCGTGEWSCLFLTNRCNAQCFFCPQSESKHTIPTSENAEFPDPKEYAEFVSRFGYRAVGISGGEPLLLIDDLIPYIRAVKDIDAGIYTWIYTNGLLLDNNSLLRLKDSGLDEVRINIVANNYDIDPVALATNHIDTTTVEIPMIPEDYERLLKTIPLLEDAGVKYLNLHELFVTCANYRNLVKRGYTFLHDESPPVLESGNAALRMLEYIDRRKSPLSINYCTNSYKSNIQIPLRRRKIASMAVEPYEDLTGRGYIRRIAIEGGSCDLASIRDILVKKDKARQCWADDRSTNQLFVHPMLIDNIIFDGIDVVFAIDYFDTSITRVSHPDFSLREIPTSKGSSVSINRVLKKKASPLSGTSLLSHKALFILNIPFEEIANAFDQEDRNDLVKMYDLLSEHERIPPFKSEII